MPRALKARDPYIPYSIALHTNTCFPPIIVTKFGLRAPQTSILVAFVHLAVRVSLRLRDFRFCGMPHKCRGHLQGALTQSPSDPTPFEGRPCFGESQARTKGDSETTGLTPKAGVNNKKGPEPYLEGKLQVGEKKRKMEKKETSSSPAKPSGE